MDNNNLFGDRIFNERATSCHDMAQFGTLERNTVDMLCSTSFSISLQCWPQTWTIPPKNHFQNNIGREKDMSSEQCDPSCESEIAVINEMYTQFLSDSDDNVKIITVLKKSQQINPFCHPNSIPCTEQ